MVSSTSENVPLVIVWVGIGEPSRIIIIALAVFKPIVVNARAGMLEVAQIYVDAARVRIEIATRAPDGRWWSLFLDRLDATLDLTALGIELALSEIYASTRAAGG